MNKYRIEYCEENGIKVKEFNKYNVNNYTDFLEKKLAAINYTHSCTELKDKKAMTFEEWVESEGYTKKWDGYFKNGIKSTYWIVKGKYVSGVTHSKNCASSNGTVNGLYFIPF